MSTATPPARREPPAPSGGGSAGRGSGAAAAVGARPYLTLVAACLIGGALSLLALPAGLGSDAWAWLVWGRELLGLDLDPTNGPSWKPLPVLFTTPLAVLGDAAPVLWSVLARAGCLLALAFAFRLGARIAGRPAGALAVLALLATDLVDYMASADSEPLAAAFVLWALERHLDGRRGQALGLLALAGLGRPEAWVLLVVYAVFVAARERRLRLVAASAAVVPPALWLGPPWLATGDPLSAGERANRVTETSLATADVPALAVIGATVELVAAPVLAGSVIATAAAVLSAARRWRVPGIERRASPAATLVLAGGTIAWVAIVAALTQAGFTGNERYLFPAVATICVLGGVGAGILLAAGVARGRAGAIAAALLLVAVSAPFALERARALAGYRAEAGERARTIAGLEAAVARAGGRERVLACGSPAVTRPGTQGTLAWELRVPLSRVARSWPPDYRLDIYPPSIVFSRAERRFNLLARRDDLLAPGLAAAPLTPRARGWQAYVAAPGAAAARAAAERCKGPASRRFPVRSGASLRTPP